MSRTLRQNLQPTQRDLERAAIALELGQVVAIPTDTVYGLAVDPNTRGATDSLFVLKGRPKSFELPVLVAGIEQARELAEGPLPEPALEIARRYWPGAVTIVVRRRAGLEWDLGGDPATIGIRCPLHPVASWLCTRVGPVAATSANLHGLAPIESADSLARCFGDRVAVIVDGGRLEGSPSTVVDVTSGTLRCLRDGAVAFSDLADAARSS